MKNFICLAILSIAFGLNANSQTVITNDYSSSTNVSMDDDIQKQGSDCSASYHAIEDGWGYSIDGIISNFVVGYGMYFGDTGKYLRTNYGLEIYIGGNYRYHATKNLYFDARVIGGYYYWETGLEGGKDKDKTNEGFIGLSPIVGLQFNNFFIFAGYRWDWVKFKLKKDYCIDRFTAGIAFTFGN